MNKTLIATAKFINTNQVVLYPTDTVWGIGCDATSVKAVQKIYQLKNRKDSKALIILVSSVNMLKKYVSISKKEIEIIRNTTKPTTIIYKNPIDLASNLVNKEDNTVAIRIVQDDFCRKLIKQIKKPLVSTSANVSGNPTPKSFSEIEEAILKGVDYVVNLRTEEIATKPSTILKVEGENVITIRE